MKRRDFLRTTGRWLAGLAAAGAIARLCDRRCAKAASCSQCPVAPTCELPQAVRLRQQGRQRG
ncbi:MAG: hypothetical protein P4L33_02480 [Capsulimonadaceae bacterium]|nr:hypothetical protein [Capsulimonadaceae bacterium]